MRETEIFLAIVTLFVIGFDVYTLLKHGISSTVSWTVYSVSKSYPIIPFAAGVVAGHLFWVQHL